MTLVLQEYTLKNYTIVGLQNMHSCYVHKICSKYKHYNIRYASDRIKHELQQLSIVKYVSIVSNYSGEMIIYIHEEEPYAEVFCTKVKSMHRIKFIVNGDGKIIDEISSIRNLNLQYITIHCLYDPKIIRQIYEGNSDAKQVVYHETGDAEFFY